MFDSINFIVRLSEKIDFKRLRKMGIKIKSFKNKNPKNGYINYCYDFNYENIKFNWNSNTRILTILTNVHKILNKQDILLSDKSIYESKIRDIVNKILGTDNFELELNRIDYLIDIKLNKLEMQTYLNLMNSNVGKYCYMKKEKPYKTSIYLKTKYGKTNFYFYDKYAETGLEKYKDIFRFEIQNKNRLIKSEFKKFRYNKGFKQLLE